MRLLTIDVAFFGHYSMSNFYTAGKCSTLKDSSEMCNILSYVPIIKLEVSLERVCILILETMWLDSV